MMTDNEMNKWLEEQKEMHEKAWTNGIKENLKSLEMEINKTGYKDSKYMKEKANAILLWVREKERLE